MPTPANVIAALEPYIGTEEHPDGSNNAPPFTDWYYGWLGPWCFMTQSWALAHGGFSDDGGKTLNLARLIGLVQTSAKGFAYCPYGAASFAAVGRYNSSPRVGDLGIVAGQVHVVLITAVNGDGTVDTIEGNYRNMCTRGRRRVSSFDGFCHPPYDEATGPTPQPSGNVPAFPGTTRRGSRGPAVRQVQQRLADRGWRLVVDGDFGPGTDAVVRKFQANKRLEVDGIVGPATWTSLWLSAIT